MALAQRARTRRTPTTASGSSASGAPNPETAKKLRLLADEEARPAARTGPASADTPDPLGPARHRRVRPPRGQPRPPLTTRREPPHLDGPARSRGGAPAASTLDGSASWPRPTPRPSSGWPWPRPSSGSRSTSAGTILEALVAHGEDADDHNLPLMDWYALEPLAAADPARALKLAAGAKMPRILPFMVRRVAAIGTPEALATLVDALGRADRSDARRAILGGDQRGPQGAAVGRPARRRGPRSSPGCSKDPDAEVRSQATALALTFGDASALASFRVGPRRPRGRRRAPPRGPGGAAQGPRRRAGADPAGPGRRPRPPGPAIRGLAELRRPGDARGPPRGLSRPGPGRAPRRPEHPGRPGPASPGPCWRPSKRRGSPPADLSADLIRQLRNLKDPEVDAAIGRAWGTARDTPAGPRQADRRGQGAAPRQARPAARRQPRPLGLRPDLPAVPRPLRHRRQRRPRADRLEPGRPRLRPVQRPRPLGPDRQGLPGPRRRHQRRPGPHRDHPGRGQGRDHPGHRQRDPDRPQGRGRGAAAERRRR